MFLTGFRIMMNTNHVKMLPKECCSRGWLGARVGKVQRNIGFHGLGLGNVFDSCGYIHTVFDLRMSKLG